MTTIAPSGGVSGSWDNWAPPQQSLGNPVDLGGVRQAYSTRGQAYDARADAGYNWGVGQRDKLTDLGGKISDQALDTSKSFWDWAKADRNLWETKGVPGLTSQMDFAMGYGTPERMAANRGAAAAGVGVNMLAAKDAAERGLMSYGVNPSSGKFAGLEAGLAARGAAATAAASTKSDRDTEMMSQELLDRANARFAVLPGQYANEAGVSMAAGNQAVNTGIAAANAGRGLTEPTGWVGAGDQQLQNYERSLVQQTQLGMQQNRDAAEQRMKQAELDAKSSSGAGALIGTLGGLAMKAGMAYMTGGTSLIGDAAGGIMNAGAQGSGAGGQYMSGDFSSGGPYGSMMGWAKRGGPVRPHFRAGGMVTDVEDENEDENIHRGYRPKVRDEAARAWREPVDASDWDPERPESDTDEDRGQNEQDWVPNYEGGGPARNPHDYSVWDGLDRPTPAVPSFAAGGEVPEDEFEFDDNLPEEAAETGNVVPPEASPSGGENTDDVHAMLNEGEFVIPKEVVRWHGEKFFQKLIQKAHDEMSGPQEAEPEMGPPQAMALAPPTFQSMGG